MKTLDQVEARTPVTSTTTPGDNATEFIISQPGSYYLTGNLVTGKQTGIRITAPRVTLDLNGFEIRRSPAGAAAGIDVAAFNCTIKNGSINGFGFGVFGASDAVGSGADGGTLLQVNVSQCNFGVLVGRGWRVDGCTATNNSSTGLAARKGATIRNCVARLNGGVGIQGETGSTITHSTASENKDDGISLGDDSTVEACTAAGNEGNGFTVGDSVTMRSCTAAGNGNPAGVTGSGIVTGIRGLITGCTANRNRDDGILFGGDSVVVGNHASDNGKGGLQAGAAGLRTTGGGSRIDGNQTRDNTGTGILAGGNDVIVRNTSGGNSVADYTPASGPNVGPRNANPSLSNSPWANF